MFDEIKFRWNLSQSHRAWERRAREIDLRHKTEKAKKADDNKLNEIMHDYFLEEDLYRDNVEWLQSQHLTGLAERYLIPIPEFGNQSHEWVESQITGKWRLSLSAQTALRKAIREEQRAHRESANNWLPWLSAVTGLAGVIVGILALARK